MSRRRRPVHPSPVDHHPLARAAREAEIKHIKEWAHWTAFVGLTFSRDVSKNKAEDAVLAWRRALAKVVDDHVPYFCVLDRQVSGRWHFHALIAVPQTCPHPPGLALVEHLWTDLSRPHHGERLPTGIAYAVPYDAEKAGVAYMILNHEHTRWNVACPRTGRCKRDDCKLSPPDK